ncbi:MAG: Xaa-Pro peptidase family protein [Limnochordia bacterium]|nr:Xaa-Pro peptidase family protein [Limnochordia bacterium]MDD2629213.1 Xaa-Pro peptidase family protein [Limnochordia bacterium]MDD4517648.1 Xaa-Pro peptidase family protein [Limnochordia bacterium]
MSESKMRLERMRGLMEERGIDLVVVTYGPNLFYFANTGMDASLCVKKDEAEPLLLVRRGLQRALAESCWADIRPYRSYSQIPQLLDLGSGKITLGLELDVMPYLVAKKFHRIFPDSEIVDIGHDLRMLRSMKSAGEIDILTQAAKQVHGLPQYAVEVLGEQPNMTELLLSAKIEGYLRSKGHQGLVRMQGYNNEVAFGTCISGVSALRTSRMDSPHGGPGAYNCIAYGAGKKQIEPGEPVLLDYLGGYEGYVVDQSRLITRSTPKAGVEEAYQAMLHVQDVIVNALKPGVKCSEVYHLALNEVAKLGYADYFMGIGEDQVSFVGHGVGLELNEYPVLTSRFEARIAAGMVIAVEPKVILPELGIVGIENTVLVTDVGCKMITTASEEILTAKA